MTMAELERRLNPAEFARIHRSTVVNLDRIASIDPDWHGEYQVVLTTGVKLRLSRGYRHRLL
jgi:two-component system LytT family response regulator